MHSSGINGEEELRGQSANPGSPGKTVVQPVCDTALQTNLADEHVVADGELENGDAFDGERHPLDVPARPARSQECHSVRVGGARIGRHLPELRAAAQGLRRIDQTGDGTGDARFHRHVEVAGVHASIADVHRTVAVLLCRHRTKVQKQAVREAATI